jgi:hypothetical protein
MRACGRLVLGSSPYWSSPTGAAAIAARMRRWGGGGIGAQVDDGGHGWCNPGEYAAANDTPALFHYQCLEPAQASAIEKTALRLLPIASRPVRQ